MPQCKQQYDLVKARRFDGNTNKQLRIAREGKKRSRAI